MSDDETDPDFSDDDNASEPDDNLVDIDKAEIADIADDLAVSDSDDAPNAPDGEVHIDPKAIFDDLAELDDDEPITPDDVVSTFINDIESENKLYKNIIIIDPSSRRTSNQLSEYELTEAIVIRASQISQRRTVLTDVTGLDNAEAMAFKELNDGKCPLILRRIVGNVIKDNQVFEYVEYWDVNTMTRST